MSDHGPDLPTRGEVADKLRQLIDGVIERNEAAGWAAPWLMRFDEVDYTDRKLFDAIDSLSAADMISTDRPFLYDRSDFERWLVELAGCR